MDTKRQVAPHISYPESTRTLMSNVIIMLLMLYGLAFYFYGPRVLILGGASVASALGTEWMFSFLFRRKIRIYDLSSIVTGLLIPLMLPASIPYQVVIVGSLFAISVAKAPFGGTGYNIFNPAAAGFAFVVTCYPASVIFSYPLPGSFLPLFITEGVGTGRSLAFSLSGGGVPGYSFVNMVLGNVPGPMGATNILVLLACLVFLLSRRAVRWQTPVSFLATTSILSLLFHRAIVPATSSFLYESMSGLLFFGAVFMLGDPVTTPVRPLAKAAHGVLCGILVMIYRHVGNTEEGFMFALLLMNATVWGFDMAAEKITQGRRRKHFENFRTAKTQKKA